jgi:hypothetical protein
MRTLQNETMSILYRTSWIAATQLPADRFEMEGPEVGERPDYIPRRRL